MATIQQWALQWGLQSGLNGETILHTDNTQAPGTRATGFQTFITGLMANLTDQVTLALPSEVRLIDDTDGSLVSANAITPAAATPGSVTSEPVNDATQALVRLQTGSVYQGRRVQGRLFIPGVPSAALVDGNLSAAMIASLTTATAPLVAASLGVVIWSRPRPSGTPGASFDVSSRTVWSELAVLRRRRNR